MAPLGLTIAYSIDNALDLIKLNPIGKEIPSKEELKLLRFHKSKNQKI
ncbi:MAG: hypothetical protein IPL53_02180 [Ignavibacteria bacterium]|nr:hypothetical protein [Ignavibacteria bacterium]